MRRPGAVTPTKPQPKQLLGYAEAVAAYRRGDRATAVRLLERCLAERPEDREAGYLAALVALETGDLTRAESRLHGLLRRHPDHLDARYSLAKLRLVQQREDEADGCSTRFSPGIPVTWPPRWKGPRSRGAPAACPDDSLP